MAAAAEAPAGPEYYCVREIVALLRLTEMRVLTLIRDGELRAADVSQRGSKIPRWRVHRDDLQAFLDMRAPAPKARPIARRKSPPARGKFFRRAK